MAKRLKSTRNEAGSYTLTYHGEARTVQARLWNNDLAGGWQIEDSCPGAHETNVDAPYKTKKACVEAWTEWAEAATANGCPAPSGETQTPPPPPSIKRAVPPPPSLPKVPSLKKSRAAEIKERLPESGPEDQADPFEPLYWYPKDHPDADKRNQPTPLNVLYAVGVTFAQKLPGMMCMDEIKPLLKLIVECFERENPKETYDGKLQTPAEKLERHIARLHEEQGRRPALPEGYEPIDPADLPFG
jgi:hypothetical protein